MYAHYPSIGLLIIKCKNYAYSFCSDSIIRTQQTCTSSISFPHMVRLWNMVFLYLEVYLCSIYKLDNQYCTMFFFPDYPNHSQGWMPWTQMSKEQSCEDTVKPVCNDQLYNIIYYLWFIQLCVLMKTEGTNLLLLTISAFWSSSRWPRAI